MEVARTSMIHAATPHFLWPFAVRYAAHQLNLWPRVSLLETSPILRWTGQVGYASVFRVWGSHAFVCDTSADKLSARAIPCVFLGFPPDAPGWQFYHPTSLRIFSSQDVTFDESVPFTVCSPTTLPLPHPRRSSLLPVPLRCCSRCYVWGAEPGGAEPGGSEPEGVEPWGAEPEGAESGGAESQGAASSGGPTGASPRLSPRPKTVSPQQLREWLVRRVRLRSGAARAGATGDNEAGGARVTAGAGGTRGTTAAGSGGARTRGTGATETGDVGGAGAGNPMEPAAAGAGGAGCESTTAYASYACLPLLYYAISSIG
ncbi:unnamed protein product [Closterium sp. NIES-54]